MAQELITDMLGVRRKRAASITGECTSSRRRSRPGKLVTVVADDHPDGRTLDTSHITGRSIVVLVLVPGGRGGIDPSEPLVTTRDGV